MDQLSSSSQKHTALWNSQGTFAGREARAHDLTGVRVVSADNHICLGGSDFWYERAPAHLKDRVPRVWFDNENGFWVTGFDGQSLYPPGTDAFVRTMECHPGAWDIDARMVDLDAEGIAKELAFPQSLIPVLYHPDLEVRGYVFKEYGRYLAELQRRHPGRFYGVGMANYWEPEKAGDWIAEGKADGLKTFMLPCRPGNLADGQSIYYSMDALEPLWTAFEEADIPICVHIGEGTSYRGPVGALATNVILNVEALQFRQIWCEFTFGGIFDRHPRLRVAFVEGGIHWIPGLLQNAEMVIETVGSLLDYTPRKRPSEYWRDHCAATFMYDPSGLRQIDVIGVDNVMWSVDYPHNESTFGFTDRAVAAIVEAVGEADARKIVSENALRFFDLND